MIIRKYDIELHRLTEDDIELVRQHRNSQVIRSKMFYQKIISKDDQVKWFDGINNSSNYYFIIIWKGKKVGLINGTILSQEAQTSTGGVFFWDEVVLQSYIPICASIILGDLTFLLLDVLESHAIVRDDNKVALSFNKSLGYVVSKIDGNRIELSLNKKAYLNSKIRSLVKRITKDPDDLRWENIQLSPEELINEDEMILPTFLEQYKSHCNEWVK